MLPHHEAAAMSHAPVIETPAEPPIYEAVPAVMIDEKTDFVESATKSATEEEISTTRPIMSRFEVIYRRMILLSTVLAVPLTLNVIFTPVASPAWIDANLYLAAKAFFMTALHAVAMIYRILISRTGIQREKGSMPWYSDGMYAAFHAACLIMHYWCAKQFVGGQVQEEIGAYSTEYTTLGHHVQLGNHV